MSKTYKLIKWYPSLGEMIKEGDIATKLNDVYTIHTAIGYKHVPIKEVENNPEFWEEVVEKDYEILSFVNRHDSDCVLHIHPNGKFKSPINNTFYSTKYLLKKDEYIIHSIKRFSDCETFQIGDKVEHNYFIGSTSVQHKWTIRSIKINSHGELRICSGTGFSKGLNEIKLRVVEKDYKILSFKLKNKDSIFPIEQKGVSSCDTEEYLKRINAKIHSIKRLSDGEIFTIGDNIREAGCEYSRKLDEIKIDQDKIRLRYFRNFTSLDSAIKVKKPIFTTEDGIDIYKGEGCFGVNLDTFTIHDTLVGTVKEPSKKKYKTFADRDKAEEWIEWNKPVLSKRQVHDAIENYNKYIEKAKFAEFIANQLKDL